MAAGRGSQDLTIAERAAEQHLGDQRQDINGSATASNNILLTCRIDNSTPDPGLCYADLQM
jgi:hypothetical protein